MQLTWLFGWCSLPDKKRKSKLVGSIRFYYSWLNFSGRCPYIITYGLLVFSGVIKWERWIENGLDWYLTVIWSKESLFYEDMWTEMCQIWLIFIAGVEDFGK